MRAICMLHGRSRQDWPRYKLTPSVSAVPRCYCLKRSAPYWSNPPALIFDIRALWRSVLSARAPECQKSKLVGYTSTAKCEALTGSAVKRLTLQLVIFRTWAFSWWIQAEVNAINPSRLSGSIWRVTTSVGSHIDSLCYWTSTKIQFGQSSHNCQCF